MPKFITKNENRFNQSGTAENRYKPIKQIRLKTPILKSDLCDYTDIYIVVEGTVTVEGYNDAYNKN